MKIKIYLMVLNKHRFILDLPNNRETIVVDKFKKQNLKTKMFEIYNRSLIIQLIESIDSFYQIIKKMLNVLIR